MNEPDAPAGLFALHPTGGDRYQWPWGPEGVLSGGRGPERMGLVISGAHSETPAFPQRQMKSGVHSGSMAASTDSKSWGGAEGHMPLQGATEFFHFAAMQTACLTGVVSVHPYPPSCIIIVTVSYLPALR